MAKLTGCMYKSKYAPGKRNNSFYEEQKNDFKIGREFITNVPEILYYIDKKSGRLCARETNLIW